jgi:hypothetical protein
MSVYRTTDTLGSVCIVCFEFAARATGVTCPRCEVPMPSPTDARTQAELQRRMNRRRARDHAARTAITFGGAAILAIAGFIALVATGLYTPIGLDAALRDPSDDSLSWLIPFWPAALLWFVFGAVLAPIARKIVPQRPLASETPDAIAQWLGVRLVDDPQRNELHP